MKSAIFNEEIVSLALTKTICIFYSIWLQSVELIYECCPKHMRNHARSHQYEFKINCTVLSCGAIIFFFIQTFNGRLNEEQ